MPRPQSPEVRRALIERGASLLARRTPVTLASLVEDLGVSTMAVYTYFGGMPGLWRAVRQEGFVRLAARLRAVPPEPDPVRHLAALGAAYTENALAEPDLYRAMFDSVVDLPDPGVAAATFDPLVDGARRAQEVGRLDRGLAAEDVALRYWASGHGLTSLAVTGVLPVPEVRRQAPELAIAVFVGAGDDPQQARTSVQLAWRRSSLA